MCDVNGPFKLCTCDSDLDRRKPHWILHRFIQSRVVYNIMGLFYQPDPYKIISLRSLKRRLNSINVFDFDYIPQDGDFLELFVSPDPSDDELMSDFELEYSNGKWMYVDEYEEIEHKHSETLKGKIQGAKSSLTLALDEFKANASKKHKEEYEFVALTNQIPTHMKTKKGLIEFLNNSSNS
jgi:hypothetical protein